ncbi:hypothetical protein WR25_07665 [Diploscapter pachys]|uniref:Uncharacterized protein n=1 Tax=Diploscapter pachys TaxID=2018661 RepID=A0A2A2LVN7_9BILA|nr:hypothetical protein WR25_07665 [Diploscapter pachys]
MASLSTSENSAFSPYHRDNSLPSVSSSVSSPSRDPAPPLIKPRPILAPIPFVPSSVNNSFILNLAGTKGAEHSDSNIYRRIHGKRKERPSSCGGEILRLCSPTEEDPQRPPSSPTRSTLQISPIPAQRSNDFKQILERFQTADKRAQVERRFTLDSLRNGAGSWQPNETEAETEAEQEQEPDTETHNTTSTDMSPAHHGIGQRDEWSPAGTPSNKTGEWLSSRNNSANRECWSPHRTSLSSNYSSSEKAPFLATHQHVLASAHLPCKVPIAFCRHDPAHPYLSGPSPSLIPSRRGSSPDIMHDRRSEESPLSHTGSTPEPLVSSPILVNDMHRAAPLTIKVPTPKRRSLPGRWIKETDIDDPLSLPLSPLASPSIDAFSHEDLRDRVRSNRISSLAQAQQAQNFDASHNHLNGRPKANSRYAGSCRRVLSGIDPNTRTPNGVYVRRSRSKDDRFLSQQVINENGSISSMHQIPIFMSNESVRHSPARSPIRSPSPRLKPKGVCDDIYKHYQQICLSHVQTLTTVADKLSEELRKGEEPVSKNRLGQLDFSSFIIESTHPILTKGKSLFYNGSLPRANLPDYPVTLMIAPCSQYAPLMRRQESHLFSVPGFFELEDQNGDIRRFLQDTGTQNLDGRNTKVIALPRLNLCSFHSLAAHHLNEETLGAEIESGGDEMVGLCRYALRALCTLLHHRMDGRAPQIKLRSRYSRALMACAVLLQEDKSSSLTKAKNVLELSLWSSGEHFESESDARNWLDTARAECVDVMLKQMMNEPGCRLGTRERYRIEFLLSATPRALIESQLAILAADIR